MVFRLWHGVLALMLCYGQLMAADPQPAELPPPDFAGRQYIDSRGCVYVPDGIGGWRARMQDGGLICGYPPTLSARQLTRGQAARPDPDRQHQVEAALAEAVFSGLVDGELAGTPQPFQPLNDPRPQGGGRVPNAPQIALQNEIAAQRKLRRNIAGLQRPNRNLCRLLGYDTPDGTPGEKPSGPDPTEGFCGALPGSQLSRLAFSRPATLTRPVGGAGMPVETSQGEAPHIPQIEPRGQIAAQPAAGQSADLTSAQPDTKRMRDSAPSIPTRSEQPAPTGPRASIAPVLRYVQVGSVPGMAEAEQVARRILALGYRPVRIKPQEGEGGEPVTMLAGPFHDRQSLVIALDRLRKAGFSGSVAR